MPPVPVVVVPHAPARPGGHGSQGKPPEVVPVKTVAHAAGQQSCPPEHACGASVAQSQTWSAHDAEPSDIVKLSPQVAQYVAPEQSAAARHVRNGFTPAALGFVHAALPVAASIQQS